MKILLANPHGFCAGVVMAIKSLEQALEICGPPIYVYHEIVHNKHVVKRFRSRGVAFVNHVNDIPDGSLVLFSAHGVSPEIRKQARARRLRTIDATCPLVAKVHLEAVRFASQGYSIVLIGHAGHDEAVGTLGEAPDQMFLVATTADADRLVVPDPSRIAYLTQTTLSIDAAARIIARLKLRFPKIVAPPKEDICYATQNRQEALKSLLLAADVVLVLGSRNSSNSKRLAEIAQKTGRPAYLVDDPEEIDTAWFRGDETVVVTAGASAPEDVVEACLSFLAGRYGATIEEHSLRKESTQFPLPKELRKLVKLTDDSDASMSPIQLVMLSNA